MAITAVNCFAMLTAKIIRPLLLSMLFITVFLSSCLTPDNKGTAKKDTLFALVPPEQSGVDFRNDIHEDSTWNGLLYNYTYNGGGVAVGDLNNDGLPEIIFTSNQNPAKVYLNEGNFHFKDITAQTGINNGKGWTTGITLADVNGDGKLDVYICKSGPTGGRNRENLLFINNGNLTFTEKGAEYNLNDASPSTQAVFFDYDHDGDLDAYITNHPDNFTQIDNPYAFSDTSTFGLGKDKLMENSGDGKFVDATEKAGLDHTQGYGLSVSICDANNDGWPDIFVANDYMSNDQLFINSRNKTYSDETVKYLTQTSLFSMGSDFGDLNNDGLQDFMVVDMKPADPYRTKHNLFAFPIEYYLTFIDQFKPSQYIRNSVQLANDSGKYSEISQLIGADKTDWSWNVLIQDFDNDGWNDIHVTNGTKRDLHDLDFISLMEDPGTRYGYHWDSNKLYEQMKTTKLGDYAFRNKGGLHFEDASANWGIDVPSISNGAAYADLDGDGALDLVVNNTDDVAFVFRNTESKKMGNHYLRLKLATNTPNRFALGATAKVYADGAEQVKVLQNGRGFESCSEQILHFGLGKHDKVDSLLVIWPDGKQQKLTDVKIDQVLSITEPDSLSKPADMVAEHKHLMDEVHIPGLAFEHTESRFNDFKRDRLIPFKESRQGPGMVVGDVNGDHLDDVFMGGAKGQKSKLMLQQANGSFVEAKNQPWDKDSSFEAMGCALFDLNGDGHLDLYVASGSNEYNENDSTLKDKLYLNDGHGHFTDISSQLPVDHTAHSCVVAADFDHDGHTDLFVGGWLVPQEYPLPGNSHLLHNENGKLVDITDQVPGLKTCGMVNAAAWGDLDKDGYPELVVAGDWMPIMVFHNDKGKLTSTNATNGLDKSNGLWKSISLADVDGDGDMDMVVGNLGDNAYLKASQKEPLSMVYGDFDNNSVHESILYHYLKGKKIPFVDRNTFTEQMPMYRKFFLTYQSFAIANWDTVLPKKALAGSVTFYAYHLSSAWLENTGNGQFTMHDLPAQAQLAPLLGILPTDVNQDGHTDLLLSGNWFSNFYNVGEFDAFRGVLLQGDGKGGFGNVRYNQSGFYNDLDGRALQLLNYKGKQLVLLANNNGPLRVFRLNVPSNPVSAK